MIQLRALRLPPPESDLDDEEIREDAGFTTYTYKRKKQVLTDRHSLRETQCQVHLTSEKCRETFRSVLTQESRVKKHGKDGTLFRFSDAEEGARLVLEEQRDHLLAGAKSEILKQECKVDSLNTCIREFQRHARSNRLEM